MADLSDLQSKLLELEENYICSGSTEPFLLVFDPNSCEEIEAVNLSSLVTNADIYVNGGSTDDGNLVLTDNDAGTPDVVIDLCPAIEFCIENNNFELFEINGNPIESGDDILVQNDLGYNATTQAIEQGYPLTRDTSTDLSGFEREWIGGNVTTNIESNGNLFVRRNTDTTGIYTARDSTTLYFRRNTSGDVDGQIAKEANGSLRYKNDGQQVFFADGNNDTDYNDIYAFFVDSNSISGPVRHLLSLGENGQLKVGNMASSVERTSPTGNGARVYVLGDATQRDTVINSGDPDYSGLVLEQLDGASLKTNIGQATPLGYRNSDGLVVPIQIPVSGMEQQGAKTSTIFNSQVDGTQYSGVNIGSDTRINPYDIPVSVYVDYQVTINTPNFITKGTEYSIEGIFRLSLNGLNYDNRVSGFRKATGIGGSSVDTRLGLVRNFTDIIIPAGGTLNLSYDVVNVELGIFAGDTDIDFAFRAQPIKLYYTPII